MDNFKQIKNCLMKGIYLQNTSSNILRAFRHPFFNKKLENWVIWFVWHYIVTFKSSWSIYNKLTNNKNCQIISWLVSVAQVADTTPERGYFVDWFTFFSDFIEIRLGLEKRGKLRKCSRKCQKFSGKQIIPVWSIIISDMSNC